MKAEGLTGGGVMPYEPPTTYTDEEIVYKINKPKHVGMIFHSTQAARIDELLGFYTERITNDFLTIAPVKERHDD